MNTTWSKSYCEIDQAKAAADLANRRLAGNPIAQAEAIAKHYARHAQLAEQILKLAEHQRKWGRHASTSPSETERLILTSADYIKRNALHDLGIALEWEKPNE